MLSTNFDKKLDAASDQPNAATLPLVSVIIPCYNQGRFVAEAIESVLGQTYPHVEVIVVDDGSTDNTPDVAAGYGDRIRYIKKTNAGVNAARNTGILYAVGEFVLFLDSDDYLTTDMLSRHMAVVTANPNGTVFYGGWQQIDLEGQVVDQCESPSLSPNAFYSLLSGNLPIHCYTVRRSALANVGLFDAYLPQVCEDWDMWLRLAAAGYEFIAVPGAIAVYRRYADSASENLLKMHFGRLALYKKHLEYNKKDTEKRHYIAQAYRKEHERSWEMFLKQAYTDRARDDPAAALAKAAVALRMRPRYLFDISFLRFFLGTWKRTRIGDIRSHASGM